VVKCFKLFKINVPDDLCLDALERARLMPYVQKLHPDYISQNVLNFHLQTCSVSINLSCAQ